MGGWRPGAFQSSPSHSFLPLNPRALADRTHRAPQSCLNRQHLRGRQSQLSKQAAALLGQDLSSECNSTWQRAEPLGALYQQNNGLTE